MNVCSNCGAPDCEIKTRNLKSTTKKGMPDEKGISYFCSRACVVLFIMTPEELKLIGQEDPGVEAKGDGKNSPVMSKFKAMKLSIQNS